MNAKGGCIFFALKTFLLVGMILEIAVYHKSKRKEK